MSRKTLQVTLCNLPEPGLDGQGAGHPGRGMGRLHLTGALVGRAVNCELEPGPGLVVGNLDLRPAV